MAAGRSCVSAGILFVPLTGTQWEWLPRELGFGSEMTSRPRPVSSRHDRRLDTHPRVPPDARSAAFQAMNKTLDKSRRLSSAAPLPRSGSARSGGARVR